MPLTPEQRRFNPFAPGALQSQKRKAADKPGAGQSWWTTAQRERFTETAKGRTFINELNKRWTENG